MIFTLLLAVFCWAVKSYLLPYYGINLPLLLYAGGFWMWSVFFVLGFYLGKRKCNISTKMLILFTLFSFVLCCVESLYLNASSSLDGVGQKPSTMLFSFFVIPILLSEQVKNFFESIHSRIFDFLVKIGFYSFGIYLTHCYILMFLKSVVKKIFTNILRTKWLHPMDIIDRRYIVSFFFNPLDLQAFVPTIYKTVFRSLA